MKDDSAELGVKVKEECLVKWDGEVPAEYQEAGIDPNNPPPQVREILVAKDGGPFRQVYRRPD